MAKKSSSKKNKEASEGKEEVLVENSRIEELEKELKEAQAALEEEKGRYHRLYAEFDNFRRRTAKEKLELTSNASEDLCTALLPILDDFNRAKANTTPEMETQSVIEGVDLIHNKLNKTLEEKGLKPIESAIGKQLDTDFHEAITMIPAPEEGLKGKIIDEVETGYLLNDKVIRFTKVVVGQ